MVDATISLYLFPHGFKLQISQAEDFKYYLHNARFSFLAKIAETSRAKTAACNYGVATKARQLCTCSFWE